MFKTPAKVVVKNGDKVIASQEYSKVVLHGTGLDDKKQVVGGDAETLLGEAIAYFQSKVGEKGNGVIELLKQATYADDLEVRGKIRQQLVTAAEGPDKAIDKMVKDFMAARLASGKPITEEVARARVMATMADD